MPLITTLSSVVQSSWSYFHTFIWSRTVEIVTVPFHHTQTLWTIIPLLISTFLMQIYFGRNKDEELGWNTAYGNSLALMFISASLLKTLYDTYGYGFWHELTPELLSKLIFLGIIILQAVLLASLDLFHSLPKHFSFFISSSSSVFVIALITIVIVHTNIPLNMYTLFAALFLFVLAIIFFRIFRWIIPPSKNARYYLARQHEIHQTEHQLKRLERYKKMQDIEQSVKHAVDGFIYKSEHPFKKAGNFFKRP